MIEETFVCARKECGKSAVRKAHNQKYCCQDCTRIATNATIMEKYHERVAIKRGKKRECRECGTPLSRYNEEKICHPCMAIEKASTDDLMQGLLATVSWR